MKRKEIGSLIILLLVIGYGTFRYLTRQYTDTKSQFLLDTSVEISASAKTKDISKRIDEVFLLIKELGDKFDEYKSGSWIWRVNNSDSTRFNMDNDAYQMLIIADSLYKLTEGKFDITIKPVFDLWKFDSESHTIPDSMLIKEKLQLVGFDRIKFNKKYLYKPKGMQLTFGAIAKGYILDRAKQKMNTLNLISGYLSCRSSMIFFGNKIPELVYIKHPRGNNDDYIASFKISNNAIGTSGDYQQYFEIDGKRYHHILNAHTGYPVEHTYSVTIINPSCALADGLSTALFIMEPNSAVECIKTIPNSDIVIYYNHDGSIVSLKTIGMKKYSFTERK